MKCRLAIKNNCIQRTCSMGILFFKKCIKIKGRRKNNENNIEICKTRKILPIFCLIFCRCCQAGGYSMALHVFCSQA